jgi:hypothetical protein
MNAPETNSPAPDQNDLAAKVAALQRQVFTLLLALIVVSGTVVAYLGYESHHFGNDIEAINAQVIRPYNQKIPAISTFLNEIVAYGQTHPDFRPVLLKYGITPAPATNPPAKPAPTVPKPSPAVPKK